MSNCIRRFVAVDSESSISTCHHRVSIPKPLGIVLEQDGIDANVVVAKMEASGNAANTTLCIRDTIVAVNSVSCLGKSLEQVMDLIIEAKDDNVELILEHPVDSAVVHFSNGVNIAAQPREYLGNLLGEANIPGIEYSCRSGSCGTCELKCRTDKSKSPKYVRPCVYLIPANIPELFISRSDR